MAKLDEVLQEYIRQTDLLIEQDPAAAPPAPLPADPAALPGAAPAPAVPAGDVPAPEEEGKTKTLTDQGYVVAVQDMLELLSTTVGENYEIYFSQLRWPISAMRDAS